MSGVWGAEEIFGQCPTSTLSVGGDIGVGGVASDFGVRGIGVMRVVVVALGLGLLEGIGFDLSG